MSEKTILLSRRTTFNAAHRLHCHELSDEENKRIFDKCNNKHGHGHNYILDVTIKGKVDAITGMVMNVLELKDIIERAVIDKVDHLHVNHDVEEFKTLNPTVENLAIVFWGWLEKEIPDGLLHNIVLYETENNWASYSGES